MIEIETTSPNETKAVGRRLAGLLRPGDVVLLAGRLGVGKTLFVAGVAEGLGVDDGDTGLPVYYKNPLHRINLRQP